MVKNMRENTKIYLAGPCDSENRTTMVNVAQYIRSLGYTVYCPFELKIENAWDMSQENWSKAVFDKDIEAINNCDIFLMISLGRESTAGTNFEQGYAYALKKRILVFQITEKPTSLMTYCGCHDFNNCTSDLKDINSKIRYVLSLYEQGYRDNNRIFSSCRTVLT